MRRTSSALLEALLPRPGIPARSFPPPRRAETLSTTARAIVLAVRCARNGSAAWMSAHHAPKNMASAMRSEARACATYVSPLSAGCAVKAARAAAQARAHIANA